MNERDGIAIRGLDRDRAARAGDAAREGDRARSRSAHRSACRSADVDTAMLATGVRIVAEHEGSKHRPVCGPGPGERGRNADLERDEDRQQRDEVFHGRFLLVVNFANGTKIAGDADVGKRDYSEPR